MNWQWIIPIAITFGMGLIGGIWALVHLVARLVAEATAMKVRLEIVVPVAQDVPVIKQQVAVHEHILGEHHAAIVELRSAAE